MRMTSTVVGLLAIGASLLPPEAIACGDKFLVIGRSTRRVQKARHPARVALYLRAGSPLPADATDMRLEKTLRQAGHKVEAIPDETALREAMASRRLDFVIADMGDAPGIALELSGDGGPQIVPVTRGDADKASAAFPLVIRSGKSLSYLSALDAAMARRSAGSSR
jgi:hypothetical protein